VPSEQESTTREISPALTPERLLRIVRALVASEPSRAPSVSVGLVVRRILHEQGHATPVERTVAYEALREEVRRVAKQAPGLRYLATPVP